MKRMFALVMFGATLMAAPSVYADCITGGKQVGHSPITLGPRAPIGYSAGPSFLGGPDSGPGPNSIVGLWSVTFLVDNGPNIWDQGYEQWHSDGTELTMDVAVPPAAGNLCVGVWKPAGKGVKLHHVGFNWDLTTPPGTLAGTFVLDMMVTVGQGGATFSGSYVSHSYDLDGDVIPAYDAAGLVTATRISVP